MTTPGISYATGCIEYEDIRMFRKMMTRHGGIIHELYAPPGYAIDATFPSVAQRDAAAAELFEFERKCHEDWGMLDEWREWEITGESYKRDFDRPNLCHFKSNWIREVPLYKRVLGRHWVQVGPAEMERLTGKLVRQP